MGNTIATGTEVPATFEGGFVNKYYRGFSLYKQLCDQDFSVVVLGDEMLSAKDVSSSYAACKTRADGQPFITHFVEAAGTSANDIKSTVYGKMYQMRYLTGM
eukprot:6399632-Prymnesium_polylepis.1